MNSKEHLIYTYDDLDLLKIADSGQCFRFRPAEDGVSFRVIAGRDCVYVSEVSKEDAERAGGRFVRAGSGAEGKKRYFRFECDAAVFDRIWAPYFDLALDYSGIRKRIDPAADPFLYEASEHEKGIRILVQDPWEMLISFIISQNKNIPAIMRSIELLCKACGPQMTDSRGKTYYGFPSPKEVAALSADELKACSFGYRCDYIKRAAEDVAEGKLDPHALAGMDVQDAKKRLLAIYGVGEKVANCIQLFGLHHLNAFPRDVWVKRILESEYPGGYPFEAYSPYNGIYQQYMFAYYRQISLYKQDGLC